jgi:hypothetical protein
MAQYQAILPNFSAHLVELEHNENVSPFGNTTLTAPYSDLDELKKDALQFIVNEINEDSNIIEIISNAMKTRQKQVLEKKELLENKNMPTKTKKRSNQVQLDALDQFIVDHCGEDDSTLILSTYEELNTFAKLYEDDIEGMVKWNPIFFKCSNTEDGPMKKMQRMEKDSSSKNKKQKDEVDEEDEEEDLEENEEGEEGVEEDF